MIKTFTPTDLIRYLYHETTEEENREIESALLCDADLRQQYHELKEILAGLNEALLSPPDDVVSKVMSQLRSKV